MSRSYLRFRVTLGISAIIFVMFFAQMMALGQTAAFSLVIASLMGLLTAGVATMSYGYKEFLQQRAFAGKKQAGQSTDSQQQRIVEIDVPTNIAFDLVLDALQTLDKQRVPVPDDALVRLDMILPRTQHLTVRETNKDSGIIRAGLKAKTIGLPEFIDFSRITIQLEAVDAQTTRIHIESKANNLFDMYDMGKNLHYVNQIALYLRKESQHLAAESRLSGKQADTEHDLDNDTHASQSEQSE